MVRLKVKVAFVGAGFVADYYMHSLRLYPNLLPCGVTDMRKERAEKFAAYYRVPLFESLDALLDKSGADIIINLTDPFSHYAVTRACLQKGKHVYSEKPTTMDFNQSKELTALAESNRLYLMTAPCSILSASAQTLWQAIYENKAGTIRLAYAEMDDGPVHLMGPEKWRSRRGVPWPYENEFSVGCGPEHLGYALTWVVAFFGPVNHVTAYSTCLIPHKLPFIPPNDTPDFSVACLEHQSGVVTRLTSGILAPVNRGLRLVGDKAVLSVYDLWDNHAPVTLGSYSPLKLKAERKQWIRKNWFLRKVFGLNPVKLPFVKKQKKKFTLLPPKIKMDYLLGIQDMAQAMLRDEQPLISNDFCLHINELTLKIHHARNSGGFKPETTFDHERMVKQNFRHASKLSSTYVPDIFEQAASAARAASVQK
ncbi:MAG: hypothetical protein KatS3mg031_0489 [Chitinophagales bacterium]|nr:MAG: hypothetical protein KatS3mg031_0489 [Chitinophagales bacterium]